MLKRTIKFIAEETKDKNYSDKITIIRKNESPFKEIIANGDYLSYSIILNDTEEYKISLEDTFHLLVNVKEVGAFHFFFLSQFFDKNKIVDKIQPLKEIEDSNEKVDLLFKSLEDNNILFVVYVPKGSAPLNEQQLAKYQENIFYADDEKAAKKETATVIEKEKVKKKDKPESQKEQTNFKESLLEFFDPFLKDKVKFFFVLIASIIIGFTLSIGVFDCYLDNKIYIFFFVFSLIGATFNLIVFRDYFKECELKRNDKLLCSLTIAVGTGLSIALYFVFYAASSNKPDSLSNSGLPILISLPIYIFLEFLSILIAYLTTHKFEKKKTTKNYKAIAKAFFEPLIKNKIRFLFILFAASIIGFTINLGVFDCYINNKIYIFFFASSIAGCVFNFIVFREYIKEDKLKTNDIFLSLISIILGFGLAICIYFIFINAFNSNSEALSNPGTPLIISAPAFIGAEILSILVASLSTIKFEKKEKKQETNYKALLKEFFEPFLKDKVKFLFILIAATIVSFTLTIGVFDCYLDNKIYIFFFIFSLIGAIFNFVVFKDYFKETYFKKNDIILSIATAIIGIGLSIGLYFVFYAASTNKPDSLVIPGLPILISLPIFIGLEAISVLVAYLLKNKSLRKKEED